MGCDRSLAIVEQVFEQEQQRGGAVEVAEPLEADALFQWVAPEVRRPNGTLGRILAVQSGGGGHRMAPATGAHPDDRC